MVLYPSRYTGKSSSFHWLVLQQQQETARHGEIQIYILLVIKLKNEISTPGNEHRETDVPFSRSHSTVEL
jgi:hypothetical protein